MTAATVKDPRCWRCNKKLANELAIPYDIDCPRCHGRNRRAGTVAGIPVYVDEEAELTPHGFQIIQGKNM